MSALLPIVLAILAVLAGMGGLFALAVAAFFFLSAEPETTTRDIDL